MWQETGGARAQTRGRCQAQRVEDDLAGFRPVGRVKVDSRNAGLDQLAALVEDGVLDTDLELGLRVITDTCGRAAGRPASSAQRDVILWMRANSVIGMMTGSAEPECQASGNGPGSRKSSCSRKTVG